jgi:hypothetical protein
MADFGCATQKFGGYPPILQLDTPHSLGRRMFVDFLVIALLDQNIQNWNKMIHLMCIRVPT